MYKPNKSEIIFLSCITLTRIAQGIYSTIPSTTQIDFAILYNVEVSEIAKIYSARSIGSMIGAISVSIYMFFEPFKNKIDAMTICCVHMIIFGTLTAVTPLMPNLIMVQLLVIICSLSFGFLDLCLQSIIIQNWGTETSRPFVQFYHGLWSLGSFIAPYLTLPFVSEGESGDVCQTLSNNANSTSDTIRNTTNFESSINQLEQYTLPKVFWPWFICGIMLILAGLIAAYIGLTFMRVNIEKMYRNTEPNAVLDLT